MPPGKVALITGGGSGMGLAVAQLLAKKGWRISIVDLNPERGEKAAKELGGIFIKTDVTKYEDQAAAFQKTRGTYGQIDFAFANAGIGEVKRFYAEETQLPPPPPSLLCQDVCQTGVIYSSYLAMHYMRRNPQKGGLLIINSSAAGIYCSPILPIYTASKHGVLGLGRSMAGMLAKENIRVNVTLPGTVKTNLVDKDTWKSFPEEHFTTLDNIADGVYEIIEDESMVGQAIEISKDKTYRRQQLEYCDDSQKAIMEAAQSTPW